jgi:hypothetical protein
MVVATTTDLVSALTNAKGGEILLLAPGNYPVLVLQDIRPESAVVIASADPANPATLWGVEADACQNLTFRDLIVRLNLRTKMAFVATHCADIRLLRVDIHDSAKSVNSGLLFRWVQNATVVQSRFHDIGDAVQIRTCTKIEVVDCEFNDIRGDGINTTDSSHVTLSRNHFTDFFPSPGDHPDAMQFYTFRQTTSATDILINDNVITRGKGGVIQGIFMGNEADIPYQRVKIQGNALAGTMYNGIAMGNGRDVTVRDNFVLPYDDMESWIRLEKITGLALGGNQTTNVLLDGCRAVQDRGFTRIGPATVGDERRLRAWIAVRAKAVKQSLLSGLNSEVLEAGLIVGAANAASESTKNRRGVLASLLAFVGRSVGSVR